MSRLNEERQKELEPQRMEYAAKQLLGIGIQSVFAVTDKCLQFDFKGEKIRFFPYSGWHTGKSIKDGRGLKNLLKQLKDGKE